jgi:hypothetical protein
MTDRDGGYGDLTCPDLNQPPAIIEGVGGGPAFPVAAPKMGSEEKEAHDELSDMFTLGAIGFAGMATMSTAIGPEGLGFSVLFGCAAAASGLIGWIEGQLAEDPPQPNYARPVVFKQRMSNPASTNDPALEPLRVAIQQGVFGTVTGNGYLDAIERLQGAQQAKDLTWSTRHLGVANLARRQLIVDLANNGAAMYAAANALKGSRYDARLKPGPICAKTWIGTRGVQAALTTELQASGFSTAEINKSIAFFRSNPTYSGPPTLASTHLKETAEKIHAVADKFARLV